MPIIGEVSGATIKVYTNDHPPPHVHVFYQGQAVRLKITDGDKVQKDEPELPARIMRDVRQWLAENRDKAATTWAKYHS